MVSFSPLDIIVIILFFVALVIIGFLPGRKASQTAEGYLLSGRNVSLFVFILTNVATWYGGILGVGEFTYKYGLLSWFTQGFPYYVFAILFALFFAKKIRAASLFTIPDKLEAAYGKKVGSLSALLIFILVSPAPYLLMSASLISLIFKIDLLPALIISVILSSVYLFKSGYKSDLYTDVFQFFVMFVGFILIVIVSFTNLGGINFLKVNLPSTHMDFTGGSSPSFIIVWFLIALWTFADPGFHQRCYAAKSGNVAKYGILISIIFWILFDFLTTATGLFARASIPEIHNPVLAFPIYAEKILGPGLKGIFYAGMFATIISTLNSFLFLSATTFGRDFLSKLNKKVDDGSLKNYTRIGLAVTSVIAVVLAYFIDSVIQLWYTIGSICIPGIILLIFGAYYKKFLVTPRIALIEILAGSIGSLGWYLIRSQFMNVAIISDVEPLLVGFVAASIVHLIGKVATTSPIRNY
ncbi:MAG: sodium:solute symporter family protein [bacterium]